MTARNNLWAFLWLALPLFPARCAILVTPPDTALSALTNSVSQFGSFITWDTFSRSLPAGPGNIGNPEGPGKWELLFSAGNANTNSFVANGKLTSTLRDYANSSNSYSCYHILSNPEGLGTEVGMLMTLKTNTSGASYLNGGVTVAVQPDALNVAGSLALSYGIHAQFKQDLINGHDVNISVYTNGVANVANVWYWRNSGSYSLLKAAYGTNYNCVISYLGQNRMQVKVGSFTTNLFSEHFERIWRPGGGFVTNCYFQPGLYGFTFPVATSSNSWMFANSWAEIDAVWTGYAPPETSYDALPTMLCPTNSALSNIVVNFDQPFREILVTNNLTFTNFAGVLDGRAARASFKITPQLITRGINWPNAGSPSYHGYVFSTNLGRPLPYTILPTTNYFVTFEAFGTNILMTGMEAK
jgi:hypothetical protein